MPSFAIFSSGPKRKIFILRKLFILQETGMSRKVPTITTKNGDLTSFKG